MTEGIQTMLILDDSEHDRYFAKRMVRKIRSELEIHEFAYAEDALSFLRSPDRPKVDLLLVDISMPRMAGFEFAYAYLNLYPELRGTAPVFIASSSLDPIDQERAASHPGVAGFVEKPFARQSIEELFNYEGS